MARPADPQPRLKRGYWTVRIRGRDHHLGKDRRKAFVEYHRLMVAHLDGSADAEPRTVASAIESWLHIHQNPKHAVWLRHFVVFSKDQALADVGPDYLHRYRAYLAGQKRLRPKKDPVTKQWRAVTTNQPLREETIRNYVRDAASVLHLAARREWCKMPERPSMDRPEFVNRGAKWSELEGMLAALPEWTERIIRFIALTGCRPAEACSLKWGQVHFGPQKCVLSRHKTAKKTGAPRIIALGDDVLDLLRKLRRREPGDDESVFLSRLGRPFTVAGLRSTLKRRCGITTDALRHTAAQKLLDDGVPQEVVARTLGHESSRMVSVYARIRDERMVEAAQKLRLRPVAKPA